MTVNTKVACFRTRTWPETLSTGIIQKQNKQNKHIR